MDARILRDPMSGMVIDLTDSPALDPVDLRPALQAMARLEAGAVCNSDEERQVGHYWLRDPALAPTEAIRAAIEDCESDIDALTSDSHDTLLWIGIGGSALGPQLLHRALSGPHDRLNVHFMDNVDPRGIESTLARVDPRRTLVVVVSKSGGTVETRCALDAAAAHWDRHDEPLGPHAIAITGKGSLLDHRAQDEGWRASLPVWDWVGGRTSITSAVGQVLMELCGWDRRALLEGAREVDAWCRREPEDNPAAQIAALLYQSCESGTHGLVVQPYSDALELLSRYLQQLIMESIGKEHDREGKLARKGILVLGNKGATDQHALMQQILDGRSDVISIFVDIADRSPSTTDADGRPLADHLLGMLEGTRSALRDRGRPSLLVQISTADARGLGQIIALFERVVGIWAELLDINAYHQPAVESGKRAARQTLSLLDELDSALSDEPRSAASLATQLNADSRQCWRLLQHLAGTGRTTLVRGARPSEDLFSRP